MASFLEGLSTGGVAGSRCMDGTLIAFLYSNRVRNSVFYHRGKGMLKLSHRGKSLFIIQYSLFRHGSALINSTLKF